MLKKQILNDIKAKTKSKPKAFISLDNDDAEQGGLPDDLDAIIVEAEWCLFDYNGQLDEHVPALRVKFELVNPVDDLEDFEQHYTAGSYKRMIPSDDGGSLVPNEEENSKAKGLTTGCNAHVFLTSLQDAGFPPPKEWEHPDQIGETIVGTMVHVMRVPQKVRKGFEVAEGESDRPKTILVVTEIHAMPGEDLDEAKAKLGGGGKKKAGKAKVAKKAVKAVAKPPKKAKPADDEEEEEEEEEDETEEAEEEDSDDDAADEDDEEEEEEDSDDDKADSEDNAETEEESGLTLASEMLVNAISSDPKAKKQGLSFDEVFPAIFQAAKKHTQRKAIITAAKDKNFLKNAEGVTVDSKKKLVKLA